MESHQKWCDVWERHKKISSQTRAFQDDITKFFQKIIWNKWNWSARRNYSVCLNVNEEVFWATEGFLVLSQSARHLTSARYDSGRLKRGLWVRAMMARVRTFSNLVKENTWSFGFFRARTFFGAHDISSFSRKLSMKKEIVHHSKPQTKTEVGKVWWALFKKWCDCGAKQNCRLFNQLIFPFPKRFMHGHRAQNQSKKWSRTSFSRMSFDHAA